MKRFRFSLQSIRELREAQEQSAQRVHGEAVRVREDAATRLMALGQDLQNAWQTMRSGSGLRVDELRRGRAWCCVLEEKQKQLTVELECARQKVNDSHAQLIIATRQREVMDRLFRKQRGVHERAVGVEQQKFLDEIATRRAWEPQLEAA